MPESAIYPTTLPSPHWGEKNRIGFHEFRFAPPVATSRRPARGESHARSTPPDRIPQFDPPRDRRKLSQVAPRRLIPLNFT